MAISVNQDTREKSLLVAFRGSVSAEDWRDNANINFSYNDRFHGKFHAGFYGRAKAINLVDMKKVAEIHEVDRIIICGHSLGGAVATIVFLLLLRTTGTYVDRNGCQMAIARFLDRTCLALRASELWLRYATLQNLIPFFPWIAPGWRAESASQ